ncbi:MAG: zinc ABC transporter substrate-binding protein [Verrucomicrobiales bacterium]|nr:zinc ABC transporter substrate-binding protein [Verrucomicrobiales bacterium]
MKLNKALQLVLSLTAFLASSCGNEKAEGPNSTITITATTGMIADIVRNVAGEKAQVENLIGEGVDPHLYKPTSLDVKALQAADIVFYNGMKLEGKMSDVLDRIGKSGKKVIAVTDELAKDPDYALSGDDEHHPDPHVWMDVNGWKSAVNVVAAVLADYDPDNAAFYNNNADLYAADLAELNGYALDSIESIPENQRVLVTAHDAFHYMARAYGLEVRGIQGLSTESEAGVKDIEDLVDFLAERKIPAVFVESSVSDKNIKALVEGASARGHSVTIGGTLFSDAMGREGSYTGTYIGMIDHNVTTIARALGGKVPTGGMKGKLAPYEHR